MTDLFTYFERFDAGIDIPKDGILSRTILDNEVMKLIVFHFAAGQELSEHTAAMPAVIQIVSGEARLTLGDQVRESGAGSFAYMTAHLKHAVYAKTDVVMVLQMIKQPKP